MSTVDDRAFELWAMETLEGNPTDAWASINSLWNNLALAEKPVHERIIQRINALIAERRTSGASALRQRIKDACARLPAPKVRWLPYDIAAFRAAAEYNASHPSASNREIADLVGVTETTIRNWKKAYLFEFKLAGQKPGVPNSQIFSFVMFEPVSLKGEGTLTVNEQMIPAADRK